MVVQCFFIYFLKGFKMKVVVFNHKGGVGKSTLVAHVGFRAMEQKKALTVIDADAQYNTMKWLSGHNWNKEESYDVGDVHITTNVSAEGYSPITIVDAPPAKEVIDRIHNVDVWLIPIDGRFSVEGAMTVQEVLKMKGDKGRTVIVVNKAEPNTKFGKEELAEVRQLGVELFEEPISIHSCVRKAESYGVPVWKVPYAIRSSTAQNIQYFADWVLKGCSKSGVY
jgi:cellulose biosynthesis protein BcsQ